MKDHPLVTVICICYNQARFVEDAIESVMRQSYPNVQFLVVDDGSTDESVGVINRCLSRFRDFQFFPLAQNSGNCRAFNHALRHAAGQFIIDLAADDILLPERLALGVRSLQEAGDDYGVNFTDAYLVDESGKVLARHSDRFPHNTIPQGDIYLNVIDRFFICSPTVMFRAQVIRELGGYDESLTYEDFDFWIRSSRNWFYCYTKDVLVKKRLVRNSMSRRQFSLFSPQLTSTFHVCEKIFALNRTTAEQKALARRIWYEIRVCLRLLRISLVFRYLALLRRNARMRY